MSQRVPIAFLIITKDEEKNLPYALESVCDWAEEVFVLDSGSTDRTQAIAEQYGAAFHYHAWQGYARQKNWALENLPFTAPWIFILDADEAITPPLREELTKIATRDRAAENAFYVNRYFVFMNQRIRHCGYYPSWNIRFFRRGTARYEQRDVHERMIVEGEVGYLTHDMEHYDRRGLEYYIAKHNHYSTLEAQELFKALHHQSQQPAGASFWHPAERKRWIKQQLWPKLPGKWLLRWLYMYVFKLGFLDGLAGFHFCLFLASYEHQITLKLHELQVDAPPRSKRNAAAKPLAQTTSAVTWSARES